MHGTRHPLPPLGHGTSQLPFSTPMKGRPASAHSPSFFQEDTLFESNMMTEVTGKLKTHFNTEAKQRDTTAGVSVIMVSTENIHRTSPEHLETSLWSNICRFSVFSRF